MMGEHTENQAIQRAAIRLWIKVLGIVGSLVLTGALASGWAAYSDVQNLKAERHQGQLQELRLELKALNKAHDREVNELKLKMAAGPEWLRDRVADLEARVRELEKK